MSCYRKWVCKNDKSIKKYRRFWLLSAGLLLSSVTLAHAEAPKPLRKTRAKPVFYAQTLNHKKEVEICIITPVRVLLFW
ncbi:Uncharacterised protein [Yersinia pseudotuberculosis]|uniref:Uncharacterized protein n=1 Tax=Yersinia pekkanenii TaxID=1288385 RepID=A0A0T9RHV7_9GAMM|nr:hypothetical protein BZ20_2906 [Yersinia pseudotuberculosis]CNI63617.1 Uncharacterised protein [Yersinia pekkanenii]CNK80997.1 Uncharacterised protein [Yersinia pseudotuberculosis]CNL49348.1 Uncharacterised protein [Yersinia pseudotuberculosis]CRY69007.1 Uncharacterised protein [Yersinia pekkanenii]